VAIALRWGFGWMVVGLALTIAFAPQIIGVFTHEEAVFDAGVTALIVLAFSLPASAFWTICAGSLRGSGDTRNPMISSAVGMWAAVALGFVAVRWFDAGLPVVWAMYTITIHFTALRNWLVLRRRLAETSFAGV
jgi:Na+-driven multidrug efflux pump